MFVSWMKAPEAGGAVAYNRMAVILFNILLGIYWVYALIRVVF